ncbi:MAG: hypothetical protein QNK37_10350 [Acidobacteriota bacterium]|nr:hypothetical protein [Acidobacteriota bacterium]
MLTLTLALMFFQVPGDPAEVIDLEVLPKPPQGDTFRIASDGTLLLQDTDTVYHWDRSGRLINSLRIEVNGKPTRLNASHYDSNARIYWLIDSKDRSEFFNSDGDKEGYGYRLDADGTKKPVIFGQLIGLRDRQFAVKGYIDFWRSPDSRVVVEVTTERDSDGNFLIREISPPFLSLTRAQQRLDYHFRGQFLTEDPFHGNIYALDQLTCSIRHLVPDESMGYKRQKRDIPFALPRFVQPPKAWNRTMRSEREYLEWYNGWSRINGLYTYGDGFLIGYEVPNPKRVERMLQGLQVISRKGRSVGKMHLYDGILAGAFEGRAHLVTLNPEQPEQLTLYIFEM